MEAMIVSVTLNVLLGIATYFLKDAHTELKVRVTKLEDNTVRKDDFKEFKEELFRRMDRLEGALKRE